MYLFAHRKQLYVRVKHLFIQTETLSTFLIFFGDNFDACNYSLCLLHAQHIHAYYVHSYHLSFIWCCNVIVIKFYHPACKCPSVFSYVCQCFCIFLFASGRTRKAPPKKSLPSVWMSFCFFLTCVIGVNVFVFLYTHPDEHGKQKKISAIILLDLNI